jgi:acyl-CoA synthetase (AMP-forming)/AMP-acid ligase II
MIHVHSLGRAVRYYPERTALAFDGKRVNFRELHQRVGSVAVGLLRHGFVAGDRLAILLPNQPEYIEIVYACAWLGVIVVPLNTRLSTIEIDQILTDAQPHGLIRHASIPRPTTQLAWELVLDDEIPIPASDSYPDALYDPEATFALLYTSGTTGHPKGVVLTHANILADIDHVNSWIPHVEGGVYLHTAPMFHIADFPFIFGAPAAGASQVTLPKFSPQSFCETVERERVSSTVLVPTMMNMLTQYRDLQKHDLGSLKIVGYGGSPIAPEVVRRTKAALPGVRFVQVYGLSETGFVTGLTHEEHTEDRLLSCGRPCFGIEVLVVDEEGREVDAGQPGELVVRGANVMHRYWNNEEETSRAFRHGLFRTGDVGFQGADGYVYLLDRSKDMIVTGGENVYSGEIEAVLYRHPNVSEAAVFGIPDPQWGEVVMACVVLKPGMSLSVDDVVAHCRRFVAGFKVPRRVEFMGTELPKNASGKILKKVLRERFWRAQARAVG